MGVGGVCVCLLVLYVNELDRRALQLTIWQCVKNVLARGQKKKHSDLCNYGELPHPS